MTEPVQILLVDDDRNDVEVALRAVQRESPDVSVSLASDGGEALEMLGVEESETRRERIEPRAVFLDLKMPGIDGWEVLQRLREHPATQKLPVVVLSWSDHREDVERCYALGANSYLVKRFDASQPGAYFAEAVRYWAELNRAPSPRSGVD